MNQRDEATAVDRVWLSHYPAGIPAEVDLAEFASLPAVLRRSCARFADRPAYSSMGAQMSYAELDARQPGVRGLAAAGR